MKKYYIYLSILKDKITKENETTKRSSEAEYLVKGDRNAAESGTAEKAETEGNVATAISVPIKYCDFSVEHSTGSVKVVTTRNVFVSILAEARIATKDELVLKKKLGSDSGIEESEKAKYTTGTVLGKGGAGKLIALANSVAVSVCSGHKAGSVDVDAHGLLAFKTMVMEGETFDVAVEGDKEATTLSEKHGAKRTLTGHPVLLE